MSFSGGSVEVFEVVAPAQVSGLKDVVGIEGVRDPVLGADSPFYINFVDRIRVIHRGIGIRGIESCWVVRFWLGFGLGRKC